MGDYQNSRPFQKKEKKKIICFEFEFFVFDTTRGHLKKKCTGWARRKTTGSRLITVKILHLYNNFKIIHLSIIY